MYYMIITQADYFKMKLKGLFSYSYLATLISLRLFSYAYFATLSRDTSR